MSPCEFSIYLWKQGLTVRNQCNVMLLGSYYLYPILTLSKCEGNSKEEVIHFPVDCLPLLRGSRTLEWPVYGWGTVLEPRGSASLYPVDGAQVVLLDHLILKTGFLLNITLEPWHFFLSAI